jgi:hypothetical protein
VGVLLKATEDIRQPDSSFAELRLTLRRSAHQLAELAKEGARRRAWRVGGGACSRAAKPSLTNSLK